MLLMLLMRAQDVAAGCHVADIRRLPDAAAGIAAYAIDVLFRHVAFEIFARLRAR